MSIQTATSLLTASTSLSRRASELLFSGQMGQVRLR